MSVLVGGGGAWRLRLGDVFGGLGSRVLWIVAGALLVGGSALAVSVLLPRTYSSEARILISGSDSAMVALGREVGSASLRPERDMATEAELVRSRPVVSAAIREADLKVTVADLLEALSVSPVGQTNIIAVRATASSPEDAARIANAVSRAYMESSTQLKRDTIRRAADQVEARLTVMETQLRARRKQTRAHRKGTVAEQRLNEQLDQESIDRHSALSLQLDQMRFSQASATGAGRLVSDAVATPDSFSPNPRRTGLLGLLVGFLISVAAVFVTSPASRGGEPTANRERRARSVD